MGIRCALRILVTLFSQILQPTFSVYKESPGTQGVLHDFWTGIEGQWINNVTGKPWYYGLSPAYSLVTDKFDTGENTGEALGQRLKAYYRAPRDGDYVFYLSCDEECEFYIRPQKTQVAIKLLELKNGTISNYMEWERFPEQISQPMRLHQDGLYYLDAVMKDVSGPDHLSVGVKLPNGVYDRPISNHLYKVPPILPPLSGIFSAGQKNSALRGHMITDVISHDDIACSMECLQHYQCVSINFNPITKLCQLNQSSIRKYPLDAVSEFGTIYYGLEYSGESFERADG